MANTCQYIRCSAVLLTILHPYMIARSNITFDYVLIHDQYMYVTTRKYL